MGIYIPKMQKPKVCVDCPLRKAYKYHEVGYFDYEYCPPLDRVFNERKLDINIFEERFDDCPIKEADDVAFGLYKAYIDGIGGERGLDPNNCKECEIDECDRHICLKAVRERRNNE